MTKARDIVVFDLDRTLTRRPTFTPFLLSLTVEEGHKTLFIFAVMFRMLMYLMKLTSRKSLKEYMLKTYMAGMSHNQTGKAVKAFFNKAYYANGFYIEGLAEIKRHKKAGRLVGVATASMDFYVEHIVKDLGLDFMVATTSVWEKGILQPMIKGENCYGPEKARLVQAFLAGQNSGKVWFYSDHHTDQPTFDLADIRVAVNPTNKLRTIADRDGYEIQNWK